MGVMFWQFMNDNDGQIVSGVLQSAGRNANLKAIQAVESDENFEAEE